MQCFQSSANVRDYVSDEVWVKLSDNFFELSCVLTILAVLPKSNWDKTGLKLTETPAAPN
jgi:hypothetical protein